MKQELRPVYICGKHSRHYGAKGVFHGFFLTGSTEAGLCPIALVELESGNVIEILPEDICFTNKNDVKQ